MISTEEPRQGSQTMAYMDGHAVAYEIQSVRFQYHSQPSSDDAWVLNEVGFQIVPGEVFGIVGPNGSGKSSLLKVLAKILCPQQGTIRLLGKDLAGLSQKEIAHHVAYVPQDTHQPFPFTVAETVLMGRSPKQPTTLWSGGFGWEDEADVVIAAEAMATMDVTHLASRLITDLSGGERQRVIMARALAQAPMILLLDEPTAFLDVQHQVDICQVLRRLKDEKGLTVVLVSHDLNLVSQYCDRILLLDQGHVVRLGVPDEVIEPKTLEAVYRCQVLVDRHPNSGLPRVTLPGRCVPGGY